MMIFGQPMMHPSPMNDATANRLNQVNLEFYRSFAPSFSETRHHAWSGWMRLKPELPHTHPLTVLDAGCGNGRFLEFLYTVLPGMPIAFTGLDACEELLATARERCAALPPAHWEAVDLFQDDGLAGWAPQRQFSLVTAFGLFHHIPGAARRAGFLSHLFDRVRPGGLLVITLWRFQQLPRFQSRIVPWEQFNSQAHPPIDLTQLERNDFILGWQGAPNAFRYCHSFDDQERNTLLHASGLTPCLTFRADGKSDDLNEYMLFRKC